MAARGKKLLKIKRAQAFKHKKVGIRKGDQVQVITGNEKGKTGSVLSVDRAHQRVIVEGVNMRFKHVKKTQQNPQGGRIESEAPIHISNVALFDEKSGRGTRTRIRVTDDGRRIRVSTRTGEDLDS